MRRLRLSVCAMLILASGACSPDGDGSGQNDFCTGLVADDSAEVLPLSEVTTWAYQIQGLDGDGAVQTLEASAYDLLVLEPTRTVSPSDAASGFDTACMVRQLKASKASDGQHRKLVIAYVDIGEAESWRWYWTWSTTWPAGGARPSEWPAWIVEPDPDGWADNYPVAFWDAEWKDIMIYGTAHPPAGTRDFVSALDEVIRDGFDGIYMDWVEVYSDEAVMNAAATAGIDTATEIVGFIREIRDYARQRNPNFIVIQQNAAGLIDDNPDILNVVDAIGQEDTWYGGNADCAWSRPCGYGRAQDPDESARIQGLLDRYLTAGKVVFTADYTVQDAAGVYAMAAARGYVPYCSRTALSRLTTTPPPGR